MGLICAGGGGFDGGGCDDPGSIRVICFSQGIGHRRWGVEPGWVLGGVVCIISARVLLVCCRGTIICGRHG